ncbi:MAG: TSUP family transporter [Flavipsychrobacter sp.]
MLIALLCCFALLAGFVDAMAGGGGLIQLPAMFILQPQLSLAQTLATNKTASFFGTSVSSIRYLRRVDMNWRHLTPIIISSLIGSFGGALLVSYIHKDQFMPFIICVLTLVLIYTIVRRNLGLHHNVKELSTLKYYLFAIGTGGLIGAYDGMIGPAAGSFFIFAFIVLFGYDFLHASANAKLLNSLANFSALTFFFAKGNIVWHIAVPVCSANMLGNYIGSHIALKKGSAFIRIFFIIVVLALILKLGYDYLLPH